MQQPSHRRGHAEGNFGHAGVVEGFGCVGGLVIVWIAEETGVGQHQGGIALVPERTVVTETDFVDLFGQADREQGHPAGAAFEASPELPVKFPGRHVADGGQEIAALRKEAMQELGDRGWDDLRAFVQRVVAHHFQAQHADDLVAALA